MKRKRNGAMPGFCDSKNVPKIKQVKLDLLNKKDLNKFLKSKEFKESKIAEELMIEYISSVKQNSPAKKILLMNKEILQFSEPSTTKIARIETVTKTKSVDKVIEELKVQEKDSSKSKNEVTTVQQQTYIPAQIKADGRINRQILGTVSGKEFVTERNNLMNVSNPLVGKGTNTINVSEFE